MLTITLRHANDALAHSGSQSNQIILKNKLLEILVTLRNGKNLYKYMIEYLSKKLLTKSYNNLELKLNSYGVLPSKESLNCLYGLLKVFSKALDKTLEDAHYICSVDPGGGKTEAIVCFVQAWKSLGFLPKGGILIAVNTKDQIHSLVNRLGLDKDDYACLAGDDTILRYGLGQSSIDDAKVLITTQQMIVSRTSGKAFSDAADFFYKGKPRSLRVWDESLIPSEPISIKVCCCPLNG